jgi:hypothetical protein
MAQMLRICFANATVAALGWVDVPQAVAVLWSAAAALVVAFAFFF